MSQSEEKVITLAVPLSLGDALKFDSIMLREPTVDELDRSTKTAGSIYAVNAALISMVSSIPLALIRKLSQWPEKLKKIASCGFSLMIINY